MRSHDQGFVGAPPDQVYEVIAEPSSYPTWWPGAAPAGDGVQLPLRRGARPAVAERHRNQVGLFLVSPEEELEWYLEPFDEGTIVNVFFQTPSARGRPGERRLRRMRGSIRAGLVGLKRRLEARA